MKVTNLLDSGDNQTWLWVMRVIVIRCVGTKVVERRWWMKVLYFNYQRTESVWRNFREVSSTRYKASEDRISVSMIRGGISAKLLMKTLLCRQGVWSNDDHLVASVCKMITSRILLLLLSSHFQSELEFETSNVR
jgi:hypothetical protein